MQYWLVQYNVIQKNRQTIRHMDIATYQLNRPRGRLSEDYSTSQGVLILFNLVIQVYTNKQMLVGVYLDPRRAFDPSKSSEIWNYEALAVVH